MSPLRRPPPDSVAIAAALAFAVAVAACARVGSPTLAPHPDGGGATDTASPGGPDAPVMMDSRPNVPEVTVSDAGMCTPSVTCDPPNGRYCGVIGNGCFGGML